MSGFKFHAPKISDHLGATGNCARKNMVTVMGLMAHVLHRVFGRGPNFEKRNQRASVEKSRCKLYVTRAVTVLLLV